MRGGLLPQGGGICKAKKLQVGDCSVGTLPGTLLCGQGAPAGARLIRVRQAMGYAGMRRWTEAPMAAPAQCNRLGQQDWPPEGRPG